MFAFGTVTLVGGIVFANGNNRVFSAFPCA